jgi:hypothetical protein
MDKHVAFPRYDCRHVFVKRMAERMSYDNADSDIDDDAAAMMFPRVVLVLHGMIRWVDAYEDDGYVLMV